MLTLPHSFVLRLRAALFCICAGGISVLSGQVPSAAVRGAGAQAVTTQGGSIASAADEWPSITIGFIGQSRYQPQAVAALAGAIDAARELGPRHRMHVTVAHRSPEAQTAAAQNEALRELFVGDTAGVLINPVDANASASLLALLNRQRMPVVTFGTPAAVAGISATVVDDENAIGEALAAEAFRLLDARSGRRGGAIGILTGPQGAEPYASRARIVEAKLHTSPSYTVYGAFECAPNMSAALQTLQAVTARERDERLNAWICVGGWPLQGYHAALPRANGLAGFIVAGGLPQMLPHLEQGSVYALVSPDYYGLGYAAMEQVLLAQSEKRRMAQIEQGTTQAQQGAAQIQQGTSASEVNALAAADTFAENSASAQADLSAQPTRVLVLPRIIRRENLNAYAEQWALWLGQSM